VSADAEVEADADADADVKKSSLGALAGIWLGPFGSALGLRLHALTLRALPPFSLFVGPTTLMR
jgi:hypothetical protein